MLRGKTEAETVQLNGWRVGDILEEGEGHGIDRIRITAIGEENIFCVWYDRKTGQPGGEMHTTLSCREWRKINNSHSCLLNRDLYGICLVCGKKQGRDPHNQ